tara:strand:+ start:70 stop:489 length:420 start_codon:yes stop_codon:yes gene_type:complete
MSKFSSKFFSKLVVEQEEAELTDQDRLGLEPETPQGEFDVEQQENPIAQLQSQQTANTINTLSTWIGEVEQFIEYLNGLDDNSLNSQLNRADCDSIMADIQRSETKKISRLAQDLSSLGESLKQYLQVAKNKQAGSVNI